MFIVHQYNLNSTTIKRAFLFKDLGIYISPSLSFEHHINVTTRRALNILGFVMRSTKSFSSAPSLCSLFFALIRSVLKYGVIIWHPYLGMDQMRIERIQNKFLSNLSRILKLDRPQLDYSLIRDYLNIPTLSSRHGRIEVDRCFLTSVRNGPMNAH